MILKNFFSKNPPNIIRVLKQGPAMRVIFFYPGEEGTYVDQVNVTLFENGIVMIRNNNEETTTHLQNCEILWRFENEPEDRPTQKIHLLKRKTDEMNLSYPGSET